MSLELLRPKLHRSAYFLTSSKPGYTNLWRFAQVQTGRYNLIIKELHDKYGPVVRVGPNVLDLDYPELIKTIYTTDGRWRKARG